MSDPLAALDIGTNTIRLLIARSRSDGSLERLDDQTVTVRLGQGVDADGRLAPERMARAADVIADLAARARAAGAGTPLAIATSAVRDAANGPDLVALVKQRSGVRVEIIDGAREAQLTFRGALLGRPLARQQLVADIGGGSTEVIVAQDGQIVWVRSLQLGSGRITERCLASDPPPAAEVAAARALARAVLAETPELQPDGAVVVGGTASALLTLAPDPRGEERLTRAGLAALLERLLAVPAATIAAGGAVDLDRARVLPGGAIVVEALLERFGLAAVTVSQGGIREGLLLEVAASGR